jgi:hypothetical protein
MLISDQEVCFFRQTVAAQTEIFNHAFKTFPSY